MLCGKCQPFCLGLNVLSFAYDMHTVLLCIVSLLLYYELVVMHVINLHIIFGIILLALGQS